LFGVLGLDWLVCMFWRLRLLSDLRVGAAVHFGHVIDGLGVLFLRRGSLKPDFLGKLGDRPGLWFLSRSLSFFRGLLLSLFLGLACQEILLQPRADFLKRRAVRGRQ